MADRRATELETKADEMDVEQHVHFSPRRQYYWLAEERIEKYRDRAGELRDRGSPAAPAHRLRQCRTGNTTSRRDEPWLKSRTTSAALRRSGTQTVSESNQ